MELWIFLSQTVRIWASMSTPGASSQSTALQDLVEKMAVMQVECDILCNWHVVFRQL